MCPVGHRVNNLRTISEEHHGGLDVRELDQLGLRPEQVLDLSSNVLSVVHPRSVRQAAAEAAFSNYPDRDSSGLKQKLATRHSVPEQSLLIGNGCSELIHLLAKTLLNPRDHVLVLGPTFSEYQRASRLQDAHVQQVMASRPQDFADSVERLEEQLRSEAIALVWICNPNNPTGHLLSRSTLQSIATKHPQTMFAIDESYIEFAENAESMMHSGLQNVIVLRSLTKSHALAGVRLGYAVGPPDTLSQLKDQRIPWTVSAVAQAVGCAALDQQSHYDAAMLEMSVCKRRLLAGLRERGFQPLDSAVGFLLVPVDDGNEFRMRLLRRGVVVRDCDSFGLPHHVRIAVQDEAATDRLLAAIDGVESIHRPAAEQVSPTSEWDSEFRDQLQHLFRMRRDVRHFQRNALPTGTMERLIETACTAPSVGLSQPWRFVSVNDPQTRKEVEQDFASQNQLAAAQYSDETKQQYLQLKLQGIRDAPEQLAVFVQQEPDQGKGLGRQSMPETVAYSVVAAIQNFWLAARAEGIGVGWVSIVDPERMKTILGVPSAWQLIAYLCVGYPSTAATMTPELEQKHWEQRLDSEAFWSESIQGQLRQTLASSGDKPR